MRKIPEPKSLDNMNLIEYYGRMRDIKTHLGNAMSEVCKSDIDLRYVGFSMDHPVRSQVIEIERLLDTLGLLVNKEIFELKVLLSERVAENKSVLSISDNPDNLDNKERE